MASNDDLKNEDKRELNSAVKWNLSIYLATYLL